MRGERPWSNYDIHGLVNLRTNIAFTTIPSYFRTGSLTPNLEVTLVDQLDAPPAESVNREVGYTVYETDIPIMYLVGSKARWRFRVSGLGGDLTKVETSLPFFGFLPVRFKVTELTSRLVHLILAIKLIRKGFAFCHATTIAKGDDAILLFGYSGTGKSILANEMVQSGYGYMSEDFTIVDGAGTVYCYPDMPPSRSRVSRLPIARYLRLRPLNRGIAGSIKDRADLRSIVILEKGRDEVVELDRAEAYRRLTLLNLEEISKLWNSPISVILNHYAYFYGEPDLVSIVKTYNSLFASVVDHAERCVSVRSRSPNFENLRRLLPDA